MVIGKKWMSTSRLLNVSSIFYGNLNLCETTIYRILQKATSARIPDQKEIAYLWELFESLKSVFINIIQLRRYETVVSTTDSSDRVFVTKPKGKENRNKK